MNGQTAASAEGGDGSGRSPHIEVVTDPSTLNAGEWDALLAACGDPNPFMSHAWLAALHASGCASPRTGWSPVFLLLRDNGVLRGACALYAKVHSYGEYVFDWAWARALEGAGQRYYPKLLCASPFTPVPGSRLLAQDDAARAALLAGMQALARQQGWSSAHVLFIDEADRRIAAAAGWQMRSTVQFHWSNREPEPYADFGGFLATLQRDKRKKIQQERRRVADAGVSVRALHGHEIGEAGWDLFHQCYELTYRAHHSQPYLTRAFFRSVASALPDHWLLFVATRNGRDIACALLGLDPARRVAYGRYWGALEQVPCLHFELCYYQPLQWCVQQQWRRFEGGAQGEHKMARGLLPVQTWSAHWLAHEGLADAVARFLQAEQADIGAYIDELHERSPFKAAGPVDPGGAAAATPRANPGPEGQATGP